MHQRFHTDEKQIPAMIPLRDVDDIERFLQRDRPALLWVKLGTGKTTEPTVRVAQVRDGKLEITRSAMIQHIPKQRPTRGSRHLNPTMGIAHTGIQWNGCTRDGRGGR